MTTARLNHRRARLNLPADPELRQAVVDSLAAAVVEAS